MNVYSQWFSALRVGQNYNTMHYYAGTGSDSFDINFAGGYIDKSHVKAVIDDGGQNVNLTFVTPARVKLSRPVPVGNNVLIFRDTPKVLPLAMYTDGALLNASNMDRNAKQAVFVAAEMLDRFDTFGSSLETSVSQVSVALDVANTALAVANAIDGKAERAITDAKSAMAVSETSLEISKEAMELVAEVGGVALEAIKRTYWASGYNVVGTFQDGFTYVKSNDIGIDKSNGRGYTGPAGRVPAGTSPSSGPFMAAGVYKCFHSFYDMIKAEEPTLPVGSRCLTGNTLWVRVGSHTGATAFSPVGPVCGDDFGIIAGSSVTGQSVADFLRVAYTSGCRGYFKSVGEVTVKGNIELLSIDRDLVIDWSGIKLFMGEDGSCVKLSSKEIPSSLLADMQKGSTVVRVSGAVEGDLIYIEDSEKYETQWGFNSRELFVAKRESGQDMKVDRPALFRHLVSKNVKVNLYRPVRLIFSNFRMEHFNSRDNSDFVDIGSVSFGTSASWFRGFYMPVLSGEVETSGGDSYQLIACYGARVGSVQASRCQYPISPVAGTYDTVIESITASFCRHAASPTTWFNKFEVKKCRGYNNFATMDSHAGFDAKWRNVFATEEYDSPNIRCIGGELTDIHIVTGLGTTPAEDPQIGLVTFTGDASMYRDWVAYNVTLDYPNRTDDIFALPWQAGTVYYENINCMGGSIRCANTDANIKAVTITNANARLRLVGSCGNLKTSLNNRSIPYGLLYMYENAPEGKNTTSWGVSCGTSSGGSSRKVLKIYDNYGTALSQNLLLRVKSCSSYNNGGSVALIEKTYLVNHKLGATSAASISSSVNEVRINGASDSDISLNVSLTNHSGYTQSGDINEHFFEITVDTTTSRPNNTFSVTVLVEKLN